MYLYSHLFNIDCCLYSLRTIKVSIVIIFYKLCIAVRCPRTKFFIASTTMPQWKICLTHTIYEDVTHTPVTFTTYCKPPKNNYANLHASRFILCILYSNKNPATVTCDTEKSLKIHFRPSRARQWLNRSQMSTCFHGKLPRKRTVIHRGTIISN